MAAKCSMAKAVAGCKTYLHLCGDGAGGPNSHEFGYGVAGWRGCSQSSDALVGPPVRAVQMLTNLATALRDRQAVAKAVTLWKPCPSRSPTSTAPQILTNLAPALRHRDAVAKVVTLWWVRRCGRSKCSRIWLRRCGMGRLWPKRRVRPAGRTSKNRNPVRLRF